MERLAFHGGRAEAYFTDGVGPLDSWLSFSGTRPLAAHPIQVIQTALPPGTQSGWVRRSGRPYDTRQTPRTLASIALWVHYLRVSAAVAALLGMGLWMSKC